MEACMETIVKAEYIQKYLCQKCMLVDHEEQYISQPYRKVVEDIRGSMICTNCGRKTRGGYVVTYQYTGKGSNR